VTYGYDASGNRTQVGTKTYSYDGRDQLMSGGGSMYAYTARGTLSGTTTGTSTVVTASDAFGQVVNQGGQTYGYDALGRVVTAAGTAAYTLSYSGQGNTVAGDGTAVYSRDPSGAVVGEKFGTAPGVLAWTDLHTDVVGQFTVTATALSGSVAYDPLGAVLSTAGVTGGLGYQSEWTDRASGPVNMLSRWYNPGTGQFDTKDTVSVPVVPNPAAGNPFAYVSDSPLLDTDPSGHCGFFDFVCSAKNVVHAVVSTAVSAYNYVSTVATAVVNDTLSIIRHQTAPRRPVTRASPR